MTNKDLYDLSLRFTMMRQWCLMEKVIQTGSSCHEADKLSQPKMYNVLELHFLMACNICFSFLGAAPLFCNHLHCIYIYLYDQEKNVVSNQIMSFSLNAVISMFYFYKIFMNNFKINFASLKC